MVSGRSPSGRATHERSQSSLSPPTVGIPNALDDLLREAQSEFRNTLLDCLDKMWLDGRESGLGVPELNALNAASGELQVLWGLHYGWRRTAQGTEAQRAETVKQGSVHDGPVP
jgi:hypothetical protein